MTDYEEKLIKFATVLEILTHLKIMDRSYTQESEDMSNIIKTIELIDM